MSSCLLELIRHATHPPNCPILWLSPLFQTPLACLLDLNWCGKLVLDFTLITLVLKPLFHFVSLLIITTFSSCSTNGSYCTTATRYLGGDFSLLLCMGGSIGLLEACKALWLTVILSCTNEQCLIWFLNLQTVNKHYKFEIWECITTQIQPQHNLVLPHI